MTNQNGKANKLTLILLQKGGYISSENLAQLMNISTKTIYRLVKKINDDYSDGELIFSEKGKGYKLNYEKFINYSKNTNVALTKINSNKRQNIILEELLLSSPKALKVIDLYKNYSIGDSAIANDEKIIAECIKNFDLALVRKNRTLAINGKEENIRKAIAQLVQQLNIIDIDNIEISSTLNLNRYDALFVSEQIKLIKKELGANIPSPYDINIFSHLYILINRSKKINHKFSDEKLTENELNLLDHDIKIRNISIDIIRNVEKYLRTKLPLSEIYFLYIYIVSSRIENIYKKSPIFSEDVNDITEYYLHNVGMKLNINIETKNNNSIFIDLANHIKPMVNRLKNNIRVKNNLLEQIKHTYENIFLSVSIISKEVSEKFRLPMICDDEIGFITLYFARIIETNQIPIQTLIMCSTGIGISELLRVKISKKFPELKIVNVISSKDYQSVLENNPEIELILTTIGIDKELPIHSLLVSAMLTDDDQNRIQKKIKEIYNER